MREYLRRKLNGFILNHRKIFTHNLFFPSQNGSYNLIVPDLRSTELAPDGLPAPPKNLWVGYGDTLDDYFSSGQKDVQKMFEIIGKSDFENVLEFGCAGGRMIRHLKTDAWGVDISADHINWCKQNLPFKFATITTIPHLPFKDGAFDLVFAGSVFTHIDDLSDAWLCELARVCRGYVYLTVHDESTMELLETKYQNLYLAQRVKDFGDYKKEFEMLSIGRDTESQVFYKDHYVRRMLEQSFNIVRIEREAYGPHTAYVCQPTL